MFYTSEPEAYARVPTRQAGLKGVDVGGGWLIFDVPEADMGCHPADPNSVHGEPSGTNHISFYCDDVRKTVEELKGRGVEFVDGISDRGLRPRHALQGPGGFEVELYQPKYAKDLSKRSSSAYIL
jgi:catechol 2,3-dioxygenase-like lactoylglutathione lyase family enzyme